MLQNMSKNVMWSYDKSDIQIIENKSNKDIKFEWQNYTFSVFSI